MKAKLFIGIVILLLATPIAISATDPEPCFEIAACSFSAAEIDFNNAMSHPAALFSSEYVAAAYMQYSFACDAALVAFSDCMDRNGW